MNETQNSKKYDLEERTFLFAKRVRDYVRKLTKTLSNIEYGKQIVRSSGSIAANYIEANESLSRKDYMLRVKICRKEAKETRLWLKLIETNLQEEQELLKEVNELMKIFGSIITKAK